MGDDISMILRWIGEGFGLGLRSCGPLVLAGLVAWVLSAVATAMCYLPSLFVTPPLVCGLVLTYVQAARREPVSVGTVLAGFSEGRYWPSMGVVWLSALINSAAGIPTSILLAAGFNAGVAAIVKWGMIGLSVLVILVPLAFAPAIYLQSRLIWAIPLVLDRRLPVADAFGTSWKLTGRVLKGFGMFVLLTLLAIAALGAATAVVATSLGVFAGGVGAAIGGAAAQGANLTQEAPNFDSAPRPGETPEQYMDRNRDEYQRTMAAQADLANKAVSMVFLAMLVAFGVWIVLSSVLVAVLGMPVIVGYRDMSALVERGPT